MNNLDVVDFLSNKTGYRCCYTGLKFMIVPRTFKYFIF